MPKKLPKEVFVYWHDDEYLAAAETAQYVADLTEDKTVGRYVLVETLKVSAKVEIAITKRHKK